MSHLSRHQRIGVALVLAAVAFMIVAMALAEPGHPAWSFWTKVSTVSIVFRDDTEQCRAYLGMTRFSYSSDNPAYSKCFYENYSALPLRYAVAGGAVAVAVGVGMILLGGTRNH